MRSLFEISLLILLSACQNPSKEMTHTKMGSNLVFDTIYFNFITEEKSDSINIEAKLEEKINRLKSTDSQYEIIRIGKITKSSSTVFKAIINKPELCISSNSCYKIYDLIQFQNSIHEINYASIEKSDRSKSDSPTKINIEELIFYSEKDAESLLAYINSVREIEYFWNTIDKFRSDIFRESNRLYFVRVRNQYVIARSPQLIISKKIQG